MADLFTLLGETGDLLRDQLEAKARDRYDTLVRGGIVRTEANHLLSKSAHPDLYASVYTLGPVRGMVPFDLNWLAEHVWLTPDIARALLGLPGLAGAYGAQYQMLPAHDRVILTGLVDRVANFLHATKLATQTPGQKAMSGALVKAALEAHLVRRPGGAGSTVGFAPAIAELDARNKWWQTPALIAAGVLALVLVVKR